MEDGQIQLMQLIGRFEPAGLLKLGDGFGGSLEAEGQFRRNRVVRGNISG